MDPELERMYRNRASLKPAERRAVEAAYAQAIAKSEAEYGVPSGKKFTPRQPTDDWTPPPEDPVTPPTPPKKDAARNRPAAQPPKKAAKPFAPRQPAANWKPPAEQKPAPLPAPRSTMTAQEAADHFSREAHQQIDMLNAGRRAGTISPEMDRQMMQQINHLLNLSNEARNSPSAPSQSAPKPAATRKPAPPKVAPESRVEGAPSGDIGVEPVAGTRTASATWEENKPAAGKPFAPRQPTADWKPPAESPDEELSPTAKALVAAGLSPERARVRAAEMDADMAKRRAAATAGTTPLSPDEQELAGIQHRAAAQTRVHRADNPRPGTAGWDAQARDMDTASGMSEAEVAHADRQRKYTAEARRQMGRGQMNEQQPLDLGSAEDQKKWDDYVRGDRQRQARYNPEAEAELRAAEDEKRYEHIGTRYGAEEASQQRDADSRGVARIPQTAVQQKANSFQRDLETRAMNGDQTARDMLVQGDKRRADSNKNFRRLGEEAAARNQAKREADPRYRAWRSQMMLAGGQPTRSDKRAINTAMDPSMTPDQRAASLQYWAAGGRGATPLDVEQAGALNAMRMQQGANLGAMMNPAMQAAQAAAAGVQAQTQQDAYRKPHEEVLAEKYAPAGWLGTYDEFTPDEQKLMYDDLVRQGYSATDAERVVRRIAVERRASLHAPSLGPGAAAPTGGM